MDSVLLDSQDTRHVGRITLSRIHVKEEKFQLDKKIAIR